MADMSGPGRRSGVIAYAIVAYVAFVAVVLWAIAFLADVDVVPTVDGRRDGSAWAAVLIDAALLLLFAVQHSVMARAGFKQWLATDPAGQRPNAARTSCPRALLLGLMFGQWRPIPTTVWRVGDPCGRHDLDRVRDRLAGRGGRDIHGRSSRLLGPAPGVVAVPPRAVRVAVLHRSLALRVGSPPDDARTADRVLGNAADERRPRVLRRGRFGVHRGRRTVRGARPSPAARRRLHRLRPARAGHRAGSARLGRDDRSTGRHSGSRSIRIVNGEEAMSRPIAASQR